MHSAEPKTTGNLTFEVSVTDLRITPNPNKLTLREKQSRKQKERNPKSTECLLKLENEGKCLEISEKLARFHFQPKEKNGGSRGKKIQL